MASTDLLRQQHDQAAAAVARLEELIAAYRGPADAFAIALQLARVLALLRIHLLIEDDQLYPAMIASSDAEAVHVAHRFRDDMGGLAQDLEQFVSTWSQSALIAVRFADFAAAANDLFGALKARIALENDYLYPLADRAFRDTPARRAA